MDQLAREASNKSTKIERESRLEARSRSAAWRCDVTRPGNGGATSQQERAARREAKEEEEVEDRKEETAMEMEEQRDLYTRAKRREGAFPDRAELSRKRQRTGT